MKIYKRYLLLLIAGNMLSLQGCSVPKENEEKKEISIQSEEENIVENEEQLVPEEETFQMDQEVQKEMEDAGLELIPAEEEIHSEEEVVHYFEEIEAKASIQSEEEYDESENTIQNALATFVLFLNDEMTIKNYTFSSLKEESKEKIVALFYRLDENINSIVPGYSRPIVKAFSFIERKGKQGGLILNNSLNEAFGEEFMNETKQNFKEGYEDMKDSFGFWKDKIVEKSREEKTK